MRVSRLRRAQSELDSARGMVWVVGAGGAGGGEGDIRARDLGNTERCQLGLAGPLPSRQLHPTLRPARLNRAR